MSKLFKLTILILISVLTNANISADHSTVIMFDLHDVILQFSTKQALSGFWRIPNKLAFLKSVRKYFKSNQAGEHIAIEKFALENPSTLDQQRAVLQTINPHQPNPNMLRLLKELKAQGIRIFICSNIGERSYQELVKRYPDTFDLIDGCIYSRAQDAYIKKDNPKFWCQISNLIPMDNSKIIFVDDKSKNLELAQAMVPQIKGLQFKSPDQLRTALIQAGLLAKNSN